MCLKKDQMSSRGTSSSDWWHPSWLTVTGACTPVQFSPNWFTNEKVEVVFEHFEAVHMNWWTVEPTGNGPWAVAALLQQVWLLCCEMHFYIFNRKSTTGSSRNLKFYSTDPLQRSCTPDQRQWCPDVSQSYKTWHAFSNSFVLRKTCL